jgi:nucleosome binding factor SPN SPT16 subunit
LGYGIGIEFRESALLINDKNDRVVEKNLVFFVQFAVENLPNG